MTDDQIASDHSAFMQDIANRLTAAYKEGFDDGAKESHAATTDTGAVKERYDALPERPEMQKVEDCIVIQLVGIELVLQPNGHWFISDTCD